MLKGSAFPLEPGRNKVTTGVFELVRGVRCYADGVLAITYLSGDTANEDFVAGEDMELLQVASVSITSGTFSLASKALAV